MALIEDVDYLLENCEQNSLCMFIDSKNRNKLQFPHCSNYVVDFEQPIRNVFGIEILDATLPVTLYNIDNNSNTLAVSFVFPTIGNHYLDFHVTLAQLGYCSVFDELFSSKLSANFFICMNYLNFKQMTDIVTNASDLPNNMIIYTYSCSIAFNGNYTIVINGSTYKTNDITMYNLYVASSNIQLSSFSTEQNKKIYYFEWKRCVDNQAYTYLDTLQGNAYYDYFVCNAYYTITQIGNYTSDTLLTYLNAYIFNTNAFINYINNDTSIKVSYLDSVLAGSTSITSVYTWSFTSSLTMQFIFDMSKSSLAETIGFSSIALSSTTNYTAIVYNNNHQLYGSILSASDLQTQQIIAPGIVNLESARFILLRCPEIENQLFGSYGNFKYSAGVALFKMTDTNSMQHLRFDFVNIIRRPFHPIGKLAKITLSFENQDSSLYDFKGIDHQLLISIKYYSPKNVRRIPLSSLNPHYNPNMLEYKYKIKEKEKLEDINIEDIILEQQKYFPA